MRISSRYMPLVVVVCGLLPALAVVCGTLAAEPATRPTTHSAMSLEEAPEMMLFKDIPVVVVAAAKREQSTREAAASVSVIGQDEIQLFGYRSLADVLRAQRSFYVINDGLNAGAGVRGFMRPGEWNARILVLVDGRPTQDPVFSQSFLDPTMNVPMEAIKRIEVVRGPGSAMYGSNAVFAVVNVVTRDGADVKNWGEVTARGGNNSTGSATGVLGRKLDNGWDVFASATGFTTQGEGNIKYDGVSDAERNFGHIKGFDGENSGSLFVKARNGDFTIEADYAQRVKDNRSATYLVSWFDPGSMEDQRANIYLRYDHKIDEGQSLHASTYVSDYHYQQRYSFDDDGAGNPYNYYSESKSTWMGVNVYHNWQVNKAFHLTTGADFAQTFTAHQNDRDDLSGILFNSDESRTTWALFAEGEWKATNWLKVIAALRLDYTQDLNPFLSPRLAAIMTPTSQDTVKALYGRAFRAPNLYEMVYESPGYNTPNPDLQPEVVDTFELVWEHRFENGWQTSANVFYWSMSDAMGDVELSDGTQQTQNIGTLTGKGIELEIQKRWETGAQLRTYATFGRSLNGSEQVTHSPEWIAGASLAFPIFRKSTFLAIEPQVVGPMKSESGEWTDPTFLTNVVLTSKDIVKGWDFQVGVYNVFGDSARMPSYGPTVHSQPWLNAPETSFLVTLTHRF